MTTIGNKIFIGVTEEYGRIFLDKHSWDCGWYWGLGYLGNKDCHFHIESFLDGHHWEIKDVFTETKLTQDNWWVILDLFKQAYALKEAAEVYRHGGYITNRYGITNIIENHGYADLLNHDLEMVLNRVWEYICQALNSEVK